MALTPRNYVDGETIITAQNLNDIQTEIISLGNSTVPKTRTVNGKELSANIAIAPGDITFNSGTTYTSGSIGKSLVDLIGVVGGINFADAQNVTTVNENLDNYTTGGIYYFGSSYTPTNKPAGSGNFGFLIVLKGGSNARLTQIWVYFARSSTNVWIRGSSTSTVNWGNWKRLLTTEETAKNISSAVSVVSPLPSGVTSAYVTVVQIFNVVTVHLSVIRDSTAITSFANGQIATGLPVPAVVPTGSSNVVIPFGEISAATATNARPLLCTVDSSGNLQVRYGAEASTYNGSFTYLTNDFSNL